MRPRLPTSSLALWCMISPTIAGWPYCSHQLTLSPDRSVVYELVTSPSSSSVALLYLSVSKEVTSSSAAVTIDQQFPFQTLDQVLLPIADDDGIMVLTDDCRDTSGVQMWKLSVDKGGRSHDWNELTMNRSTTLRVNDLPTMFFFRAAENGSLVVFGDMCPAACSDVTGWVSSAQFSNSMLSLSSTFEDHEVTMTVVDAPPVAQAGVTIATLPLVSNWTTGGKVVRPQNFVLVGGHTHDALLNTSRLAVFSLPESSWTFVSVNQSWDVSDDLATTNVGGVEPRSGHTAVMTDDNTRIIVYGGWVGDVTIPATPQLVVLHVGQEYGGSGPWKWTVPTQTGNPLSSQQGIYGHGAVMLPGNVMMVSGQPNIGVPAEGRTAQRYQFYSVDTATWSHTYTNPSRKDLEDSAPSRLAAPVVVVVAVVVFVVFLLSVTFIPVCLLIIHCRWRRTPRRSNGLREKALSSSASLEMALKDPSVGWSSSLSHREDRDIADRTTSGESVSMPASLEDTGKEDCQGVGRLVPHLILIGCGQKSTVGAEQTQCKDDVGRKVHYPTSSIPQYEHITIPKRRRKNGAPKRVRTGTEDVDVTPLVLHYDQKSRDINTSAEPCISTVPRHEASIRVTEAVDNDDNTVNTLSSARYVQILYDPPKGPLKVINPDLSTSKG